MNRVVELFHAVIDRTQVDVGAGPGWIQPYHLFEMVGGTFEVVHHEADGRHAVMDVGQLGVQIQGLQIQVVGLLNLALGYCLASLLA